MKMWLTAGGFTLAFIFAGVVLATREDLGEMDQIASVGSFALALIALAATAIAAVGRRAAEPPASSDPAHILGGQWRFGKIEANSVQIGHGTKAYVNQNDGSDDD